jgi:SH3-like domain-containing protein
MTLVPRSILVLSLVAGLGSLVASQSPEIRFGKIARDGARLLNVPDGQGRVLAEPQEGAVVRIHESNENWTKAEVADGFPVWVHRRFTKATSDPDVVEITGNGVNVRALPSSGVNNFPVGQLYAGDRVRVRETPPELAEEAEEWLHITSPEGFWAWTRTADLTTLSKDEGERAWNEARGKIARDASAPRPAASAPAPAEPKVDPARVAAVRETLAVANEMLESERKTASPDYAAVRRAYDAVLRLEPDPSVSRVVAQKLETVALLESTASLRAELEAERRRSVAERNELERAILEDARRKDPLGDVFDERGLLERRTIAERTRYFLRWGGKDVCEVVCTTGRYDVDLFLGLDVGVHGERLPLPDGPAASGSGPAPIMDVSRIEILAAR